MAFRQAVHLTTSLVFFLLRLASSAAASELPQPPSSSRIAAINVTLDLTGVSFSNWTAIQTGTLQLLLLSLLPDLDLSAGAINVTQVYPTPVPTGSRKLLSSAAPVAEGICRTKLSRALRRLFQIEEASTTVQVTISLHGPAEYDQVQEQLQNITSGGNSSNQLYGAMYYTGIFSGLSAVAISEASPVQSPSNPFAAAPTMPPGGPQPPGLSKAVTAVVVVLGIIFIILSTLAVTFMSYRIHKHRKRKRLSAVGKALRKSTSLARDCIVGPLRSLQGPQTSSPPPLLDLDTSPSQQLQLAFSDWLVASEEIEICRRPDGSEWELGMGGFGTVFKAMRGGVTTVAVKVIREIHTKSLRADKVLERQELFEREILLLKSCRDKHIVQFLGACMEPGKLMLITEFMEGGDLSSALERDRSEPKRFSWWRPPTRPGEERKPTGLNRQVALGVARGLAFLHHRKIVHRDIKSSNILLSRDGTAKLADVGLAKILRNEFLSTLQGQLGTFAWSAPEVLLGRVCSEKVDIYSFGVVLWELSTGMQPDGRFLRPISAGEDCPEEVAALMLRCLKEDPNERPSAVDIVHALQQ